MAQGAQAAFFSYSRDDSEFALRLAEDLKTAGAKVWMDQLDIEPGMPWDRAVESAVTNCPQMLVILSPTSVNSDNVRDEISFALSKQKRVIPVLYRACDVPFRLARLQHIDFRTDYARGLKTLLKILSVDQQSVAARGAEVLDVPTERLTEVSDEDEHKRATEQAQEERKQAEQARLEETRKQDAEQELTEHALKAQQWAERARQEAEGEEPERAEAQRNAEQSEIRSTVAAGFRNVEADGVSLGLRQQQGPFRAILQRRWVRVAATLLTGAIVGTPTVWAIFFLGTQIWGVDIWVRLAGTWGPYIVPQVVMAVVISLVVSATIWGKTSSRSRTLCVLAVAAAVAALYGFITRPQYDKHPGVDAVTFVPPSYWIPLDILLGLTVGLGIAIAEEVLHSKYSTPPRS